MEDRPAPEGQLNEGAPTPPRIAATVILLRDAADLDAGSDLDATAGFEVLLVQRNPDARFMGGAWVFPGGVVSRHDKQEDSALRAAALRECEEEAGIRLEDPSHLVPFSRWITPERLKIRFDTWFFLARAPAGQEPEVDGSEIVGARWLTPDSALEAAQRGELLLVLPTIKHLEQLRSFSTVSDLLDHARGREIQPVSPKVVGSGDAARVLLPGDSGYED